MWLQRYTNYLLNHRLLAITLTFAITFVPILGVLGILYAALVTLVQRVMLGALFTLAATLPYLISFIISGSHPHTLPLLIWAAIGVAVLSNVLTWAFAIILRREPNWRLILESAALLGVLVVSVIHLIYPDVAVWWEKTLQSYYTQAELVVNQAQTQPLPSLPNSLEIIQAKSQYATGVMTTGILCSVILQLIMARWWQAIVFQPGLLRQELHHIRLSQLSSVLFIISFGLQYLGNNVILDIMPILYVLFGAAGLSLIHYMFDAIHSPTGWFWLTIIYLTLFLSLPVSIIVLSVLAILDSWFDLRKRFRATLK